MSKDTAAALVDTAIAGESHVIRWPLRFLTCGSVGTGKSTLVCRLLYGQQCISKEELKAPQREPEREQGLTIESRYRSFSTCRRTFFVADTRGDEQDVRDIAMVASNCDLAVIVVDPRIGLTQQTRRHCVILSLLGIHHVVVAVNKIELAGREQSALRTIAAAFSSFAESFQFQTTEVIPISARDGDNVCSKSARIAWYTGPTLLEYLERVKGGEDRLNQPFRMAIQRSSRPNLYAEGYTGKIASGLLRVSDEVVVAGTGHSTKIARLITGKGNIATAFPDESVTVALADDVDIADGDLLMAPQHRAQVADQFAAHLIWLSEEPLLPGRSYLINANLRSVVGTVTEIKHRVDTDTLAKLAAKSLHPNEIAFCNFAASAPVAFDPYGLNRQTGRFILIDRDTDATVAAGMFAFALRRATNIHYQDIAITKQARALLKRQQPVVLWLTGLSGSGKSTIANLVESRLHALGAHTIMLDGDNVRHGLNRDLGFTDADRVENIRRVGEVAKLMLDAGLVLCSFISPFRAERRMVRELFEDGEFLEIFVDTPLELCIERDPKGLYRRALAGEIKNFTGIDQAYDKPEEADIHILPGIEDASTCADEIIRHLESRNILRRQPAHGIRSSESAPGKA